MKDNIIGKWWWSFIVTPVFFLLMSVIRSFVGDGTWKTDVFVYGWFLYIIGAMVAQLVYNYKSTVRLQQAYLYIIIASVITMFGTYIGQSFIDFEQIFKDHADMDTWLAKLLDFIISPIVLSLSLYIVKLLLGVYINREYKKNKNNVTMLNAASTNAIQSEKRIQELEEKNARLAGKLKEARTMLKNNEEHHTD